LTNPVEAVPPGLADRRSTRPDRLQSDIGGRVCWGSPRTGAEHPARAEPGIVARWCRPPSAVPSKRLRPGPGGRPAGPVLVVSAYSANIEASVPIRRRLVNAVPERGARRGLTRETIVARALEIGNAEGLEAVSLRRVAADLGVTPMALYRHVRDKQDLINAMTEAILDGIDLTEGLRPSMSWTEKVRQVLHNFRDRLAERPLALPLSIAYSGEGPPSFWRIMEDLLGVLLAAGFERRQAVLLIRTISNLVSGYLWLVGQGESEIRDLDPHDLDLLRRQMELSALSLPRDRFPRTVASARELVEVWLGDPDLWWQQAVDLIVLGLERMLQERREGDEIG
jgi:TetR/AcrR family tetracycline transcriptional repressor